MAVDCDRRAFCYFERNEQLPGDGIGVDRDHICISREAADGREGGVVREKGPSLMDRQIA